MCYDKVSMSLSLLNAGPKCYTSLLRRMLYDEKIPRGGSRAAATSKMETFVIIVNGFQPLTIITKRSILDVAAALDPRLIPLCLHLFLIIVSSNSKEKVKISTPKSENQLQLFKSMFTDRK